MATAPSRTILSRTRGFDDAVPLLTELGWFAGRGFWVPGQNSELAAAPAPHRGNFPRASDSRARRGNPALWRSGLE